MFAVVVSVELVGEVLHVESVMPEYKGVCQLVLNVEFMTWMLEDVSVILFTQAMTVHKVTICDFIFNIHK